MEDRSRRPRGPQRYSAWGNVLIESIDIEMQRLRAKPLKGRRDPSPATLELLEDEMGAKLPDDYRQFLLKYGNYRVGGGCIGNVPGGLQVELFTGFTDDADFPEFYLFDELEIFPHAITIANDAFGNYYELFTTGRPKNCVYFYQHDGCGGDFTEDPNWNLSAGSFDELPKFDNVEEKPNAFANLYFVADTFLNFLSLCQPIEPD